MFIGTSSTRSKLACAFVTMMLIMTQSLFAQESGSLKGRVLDKETGDALVGANVVVMNTSLGAGADLDGKFIIYRVPVGKRTLKISYIGYKPITVDVTIAENTTLEQDFRLAAGVLTGETVVITAQARGQLSSINEQLSSNKIVNVVSAEKMRELPDANLAESIGRLPGVSLGRTAGEADKVVVRGLSSQFNKVTIEGVPMVSTSGGLAGGNTNNGSSNYSDRSIDLSMISDDLVKGVELSKSLRADMDADALGGTINLTLKQAPSELHHDIQITGGYNALTKYWKNYKVSGSVSDRFLDDAIGVRLQLNAQDKTLPSQQFNGGYDGVSTQSKIDPATGKAVSSLIRKTNSSRLTVDNLDRKRYGGSVILDYESNFVDLIFFNLYNQKKDHDERYDNNINFQATGDNLFSKLYGFSDFKTEERTHSLQSKFKFQGTELSTSLSYSKANYSNPGYDFPFMQLGTPSLFGANAFTFADPKSLMATAGDNNPANMYLRNLDITDNSLNDNTYDARVDYHIPFKLSDAFSGKMSVGGKYHEFSRSNNGTSQYFNMEWGGSAPRQQAFIAWLKQNVNPAASMSGVNLNHGITGLYFMDSKYTPPKFLNGDYKLDTWGYDMALLRSVGERYYQANGSGYYLDGAQSYNSDYDETEKLAAGYLMGEFNVGSELTIVPGVRYEELKGNYSAYVVYTNNNNQNGLAGQKPVWRSIPTTHVNYFPSVNIKYKATENVQLMGAYYRSAARPEFSALSPLVDYPVNGNVNASSNPYLKPAIATNFDVGASLFSNDIGLFSVNLFYKEIKDFVYSMPSYMPYKRGDIVEAPSDMLDRLPTISYFDTAWFGQTGNQSLTTTIPINNPEKAFVRGIECSWQTHLWYLPGVLSGIVLDLNFSLMNSSAYYPYFDGNTVIKDSSWNGSHTIQKFTYYQAYRTRAGSLTNMPKATYNVIAGWDYLGFSSRVSFRYQQTTLTSLDSKYSLADSYYDNVLLLDISLKQKVIGNLSVFANLTNVNSHVDDYYYTSPNGNLSTSSQTYGLNGQFGFSYNY
jgi:TonB-dependent receptor